MAKKINQNKTPEAIYRSRLEAGDLEYDPMQEKAVMALQSLYDRLLEYASKPATRKGLMGLLSGLGGGLGQEAEEIKGVYIYGGVGRGKSMLMDIFYNSLPQDSGYNNDSEAGDSTENSTGGKNSTNTENVYDKLSALSKRRVHFHEFMIEVHDYIHSRRSEDSILGAVDNALPSLADIIYRKSRILCFDEFHITDVADAMILGRLFKILFEKGVIVVATSNWPPDKLYEGGLQRERFLPFIELLKSKMDIFYLDSPHDYRSKGLQEEEKYLTPLGRATTKRMNDIFKHLSGGKKPEKKKLHVKGRVISVLTADRVARFSFSELCEKPMGAEDYIMIADSYDTILIDNIPKLRYDRRNEVKRLMNLIDVLYEKHIQLIISADAPPDKLYFGHDHSFEFQRTISRLQEMQSTSY